jgi:hypothetical protein
MNCDHEALQGVRELQLSIAQTCASVWLAVLRSGHSAQCSAGLRNAQSTRESAQYPHGPLYLNLQ